MTKPLETNHAQILSLVAEIAAFNANEKTRDNMVVKSLAANIPTLIQELPTDLRPTGNLLAGVPFWDSGLTTDEKKFAVRMADFFRGWVAGPE